MGQLAGSFVPSQNASASDMGLRFLRGHVEQRPLPVEFALLPKILHPPGGVAILETHETTGILREKRKIRAEMHSYSMVGVANLCVLTNDPHISIEEA